MHNTTQREPDSKPTRFRKKPVEIYAIRFDGTNHGDIQAFTHGRFEAVDPGNFSDPDIVATVYDRLHSTWIGVKAGNWIAQGIHGEHYPIDAAVMADTYEAAGDA